MRPLVVRQGETVTQGADLATYVEVHRQDAKLEHPDASGHPQPGKMEASRSISPGAALAVLSIGGFGQAAPGAAPGPDGPAEC